VIIAGFAAGWRCNKGKFDVTTDEIQEIAARAIYNTHWKLPEESARGLDPHFPPTWETASEAVRDWVRKQAAAAIAAYEAVRE